MKMSLLCTKCPLQNICMFCLLTASFLLIFLLRWVLPWTKLSVICHILSLFLPLPEIINVWLLCRRFIVGWLVWHFCVSHSKSCYHILAISWSSFRRLLSSVWSDNVKSNKRYSSNARICSILLCHSLTCVENVHFQIDGLERENNQKFDIKFW